jgi:hypothetical protein
MSRFTDFFWPRLEGRTGTEAAEDRHLEIRDIEAARAHTWTPNEELALEEARRLADSEEDRRRSAEGKATTYLLFASAFAAALIPFLPGILEGKTGAAPGWVIAAILIVATLYLVAAGLWAFRTLKVGTYQRLDVAELAHIWGKKDPRRSLIQETLALTRMNYRAVNDKVSCIIMAHAFIARSFVAFGILIVVEAGWEAVSSITHNQGNRSNIEDKIAPGVEREKTGESVPSDRKSDTDHPAGRSTSPPPDVRNALPSPSEGSSGTSITKTPDQTVKTVPAASPKDDEKNKGSNH